MLEYPLRRGDAVEVRTFPAVKRVPHDALGSTQASPPPVLAPTRNSQAGEGALKQAMEDQWPRVFKSGMLYQNYATS